MHHLKLIIEKDIELAHLIDLLIEMDTDFVPRLSQRVSLNEYAKKLIKLSNIWVAIIDNKVIGFISLYCNDPLKKIAYIPVIGIKPEYRRQGIASLLLNKTIKYLKTEGFESLTLETWEGSSAQYLYENFGFIILEKVSDRGIETLSLKMKLWFGNFENVTIAPTTSTEFLKNISFNLDVNFFVKHDELFPCFGGGNKARKLFTLLKKIKLKIIMLL